MPMLDMNDVLAEKCPRCNAAPTGKCLEPKHGGIGGSMWVENPHAERISVALANKIKKEIKKEIRVA